MRKGEKMLEEQKRKIGLSVGFAKGNHRPKCLNCNILIHYSAKRCNNCYRKMNREGNHYEWKGEKVGYTGLHNWIRKHLGKPTKCKGCGRDGLIGKKIHWANKSRNYLRDLTDWIRLCVKCHKAYDTNL